MVFLLLAAPAVFLIMVRILAQPSREGSEAASSLQSDRLEHTATVRIQSLEVTRNGWHVHLMGVFHPVAVSPGSQVVLPSPASAAELSFNARITHYSDDCTRHYLSVTNAGHVCNASAALDCNLGCS